jgi:hypothetical protein
MINSGTLNPKTVKFQVIKCKNIGNAYPHRGSNELKIRNIMGKLEILALRIT